VTGIGRRGGERVEGGPGSHVGDYNVVMPSRAPRSIRFESNVAIRLDAYVAAHPGLSGSSAVNQFVDEALRMAEHPGIFFRDGATGRRAVLLGGPDVWEIIRDVRSARESESKLRGDAVVALVSSNTGATESQIRTAIRYWSAYPEGIDAFIHEADRVEDAAQQAWEREQGLLAG
jgi:hypothetical protein